MPVKFNIYSFANLIASQKSERLTVLEECSGEKSEKATLFLRNIVGCVEVTLTFRREDLFPEIGRFL